MKPAVRYPLPLADRLRLRHGLTWARPIPSLREIVRLLHLDAPTLRLLLGILAVYAFVGTLDYADAQRIEAEHHARAAQTAQTTLAECMNGNARWLTENIGGNGFGLTLIECQRALEMTL
jgi:hypothetical protein